MGLAKKTKRRAIIASKHSPGYQQRPLSSNISYYYLACLLIIASVLLYGHSLWNPLVFDDLPFFVDSNLRNLSSTYFYLDLRWLSYASFGWTYKLFGLDWFWYRIGNLALHVLTSIMLFVFFSRLLDATAQPQNAVTQPRWPAFFGALIFALHPAAVYGVAYLVERSIIMATLFGIASLLCYMEGMARDNAKWFIVSALFYFLAVFSKEHSIMIPGVAAALTLLLHKPSFALIKKVWLPFALYLVIGILIILRTKGLLGTTYEPVATEMLSRLSGEPQEINIEHAFGLSVITEGFLFFKYLLLWIIPYTGWMSIDIRQPFATHFLSWPELPGFILFLAYPVLAMKLLLKRGWQGLIGFGLLFPWVLYLTELSTVRIQEPFVLYRSYLWMSGLPIALFGFMGATPRKFIPALLAAFCLALASLAWNRLDTFSDPIKIWTDAIEKNQDEGLIGVERAYNNRGNAYETLGRLPEALADYQKSIVLNPKYPEGYYNSGNMYADLNNLEEALRGYNTAIQLRPDYAAAYENRSDLLAKMGRHTEALSDFNRVVQLKSGNPSYYSNRARANFELGKLAEALSDFDKAIQLSPRNPSYYTNRARINFNLGKFQEAQNDYAVALNLYDEALRQDAKNSKVLLKRGFVLNALNRKTEANESFRRSCDSGNPEACKQLR